MGLFSELKLAVPWGHIAAKAWGSQRDSPVLCLHGWLDNANSFDRLIPLLPKDFYYVAMDFGGHGLSSHHSPGLPFYQNFVCEVYRVAVALKWSRFTILGHSFGGTVGGMFSCIFPEMVDKLVLLDSIPFILDFNEVDKLLTYKRKLIERTLWTEQASKQPSRGLSREELLQRLLKNNSHVGEECGELLLQRGTTQVATGLVLSRDPRLAQPEQCSEFVSRELFVHFIKKMQASVLLLEMTKGYYGMREKDVVYEEPQRFIIDNLRSVLKERFQVEEVPGNHYTHMNQPNQVAGLISSFLQSRDNIPASL